MKRVGLLSKKEPKRSPSYIKTQIRKEIIKKQLKMEKFEYFKETIKPIKKKRINENK